MDDLISRQAAIKAIEDLPNCYNGFSDTYDKAHIIGVLEELPSARPNLQQTCNQLATDCISRQAAIDVLKWFTQTDTLGFTPRQIVEALPSAQSERVGVWWFEEYPDGYYHAECSECGQWFEEDAFLKRFKFCPNCGCAMKG